MFRSSHVLMNLFMDVMELFQSKQYGALLTDSMPHLHDRGPCQVHFNPLREYPRCLGLIYSLFFLFC